MSNRGFSSECHFLLFALFNCVLVEGGRGSIVI